MKYFFLIYTYLFFIYRPRRKSGSNESISLPNSLPRRKQSIPTTAALSSLEAEDIGKITILNYNIAKSKIVIYFLF